LKLKGKNHVFSGDYTFICEILALVVFFLLTLCSIQKYEKYISDMEFQNSVKEEKKASAILETASLTKASAFMFEWAVICQLTVSLLSWIYIWAILTDTSSMPFQKIVEKLKDDFLQPQGNLSFNRSLPLVLLLIEFCINNIPFLWTHYIMVFVINALYMLFQYNLSLY